MFAARTYRAVSSYSYLHTFYIYRWTHLVCTLMSYGWVAYPIESTSQRLEYWNCRVVETASLCHHTNSLGGGFIFSTQQSCWSIRCQPLFVNTLKTETVRAQPFNK